MARASALIFFAYAGFARVVMIAGEVEDPSHTLPRAITLSLTLSTLLYLAVAVVGLGLVSATGLASSPAPLHDALAPTGLVWAQILVSLGALVATADVLLTSIWGLSRLVFAMAGRGDVPSAFGRLDRRGLPRNAILLVGLVTVPLTAVSSFGLALTASSLGQLTYYGLMNVAALRLSGAQRLYPWAISLVGLLGCVGLALSLPPTSILGLLAVVGVGLVYYYLRRRSQRGGPHGRARG